MYSMKGRRPSGTIKQSPTSSPSRKGGHKDSQDEQQNHDRQHHNGSHHRDRLPYIDTMPTNAKAVPAGLASSHTSSSIPDEDEEDEADKADSFEQHGRKDAESGGTETTSVTNNEHAVTQQGQLRKGQQTQSVTFGTKESGNIQDIFGFDPDGESDSDGESEASETPDDDIDIADDDDDYDGVDKLSDSSDKSEDVEKDFEEDLLAAGEGGIDWNDETTYAYDDSWQANQYSYAVELDSPIPITDNAILSLAFDQDRRQSMDSATPNTPTGSASLGRLLFDDDSSDDNLSNGSRLSNSADLADNSRRNLEASADDSQDDVESATSEAVNDDTDEDEAPALATSPTSSFTDPKKSSILSTPVSTHKHDPNGSTPTPLRKLVLDPRKAICISTKTPSGRAIHFTLPKNPALKVISIRASPRTSTSSQCGSGGVIPSAAAGDTNNFDLRAVLDHGVGTRTGSVITDVINGRLFQQYHCSPRSASQRARGAHGGGAAVTEFARNPFLNGIFRPMYPSRQAGAGVPKPGGLLDDLGNFVLDDEGDDEDDAILALIDFEAGEGAAECDDDNDDENDADDDDDDVDDDDLTPGDASLDDRLEDFDADLLATPSKAARPPPTIVQCSEDDVALDHPSDDADGAASSAVRKRRASASSLETSSHAGNAPALKKKRAGAAGGEIAVEV